VLLCHDCAHPSDSSSKLFLAIGVHPQFLLRLYGSFVITTSIYLNRNQMSNRRSAHSAHIGLLRDEVEGIEAFSTPIDTKTGSQGLLLELDATDIAPSGGPAQMSDFTHVASYNWLDSDEPVILVPGMCLFCQDWLKGEIPAYRLRRFSCVVVPTCPYSKDQPRQRRGVHRSKCCTLQLFSHGTIVSSRLPSASRIQHE